MPSSLAGRKGAAGEAPTWSDIKVPQISQDDLGTFFSQHFSSAAVENFNLEFFGNGPPALGEDSGEQYEHEHGFEDYGGDEDEDDLGYYPDGVKRTLTDEQIAMFRHSEMHALQRAAEKAGRSAQVGNVPAEGAAQIQNGNEDGSTAGVEDGEVQVAGGAANKKKRKRKGKKARPPVQREPKPDLRKRTWDVVDKGLDSLEYD